VLSERPGGEVAVEYHVHVPYRVLLGNVETVNGSVTVRGVEGSGELRSVNGNVEVTESTGRFSEKTTNGNVRLELRQLSDGGPMNLETVNGSVVLGLPSTARANLKVLSMNGDVYSELPVTSTAGSPGARAFQAKLGAGGGQISVRTSMAAFTCSCSGQASEGRKLSSEEELHEELGVLEPRVCRRVTTGFWAGAPGTLNGQSQTQGKTPAATPVSPVPSGPAEACPDSTTLTEL